MSSSLVSSSDDAISLLQLGGQLKRAVKRHPPLLEPLVQLVTLQIVPLHVGRHLHKGREASHLGNWPSTIIITRLAVLVVVLHDTHWRAALPTSHGAVVAYPVENRPGHQDGPGSGIVARVRRRGGAGGECAQEGTALFGLLLDAEDALANHLTAAVEDADAPGLAVVVVVVAVEEGEVARVVLDARPLVLCKPGYC